MVLEGDTWGKFEWVKQRRVVPRQRINEGGPRVGDFRLKGKRLVLRGAWRTRGGVIGGEAVW